MSFMRLLCLALLLTVALILITSAFAQSAAEPKIVVEEFFSRSGVNSISLSRDGSTLIFAESHSFIKESRFKDGEWSPGKPVEFSRDYSDGDPFVSPDGKQLFFWSTRPVDGKQKGTNLWVADRAGEGWSAPRYLGESINASGGIFPSVAANGNLYFASTRKDSLGGQDIYRARRVGNGYTEPENLGPVINSAANEWDAYIAPDESYLVFVRQQSGRGVGDLHISEWKNGTWSTPRNLGPEVNTEGGECCPAVSRDGRHFYFTSDGRGGIKTYQIDIDVLGVGSAAHANVGHATEFAPGRISRPSAMGLTFAPDAKTAYFFSNVGKIMISSLKDGKWAEPEMLTFSDTSYKGYPFLAPDGKRIYFWSDRPMPGAVGAGLGVWTTERTANGWSEPTDLGPAVNGDTKVPKFSPSVTADGTIYFAVPERGLGGFDIYCARRTANGYVAPENVGPVINTDKNEPEVYVSPDERFMIVVSDRAGGQGALDLYVSQRKEGKWSAPRNLGPTVNSAERDAAPTADSKYLYFWSNRGQKRAFYRVKLSELGLE